MRLREGKPFPGLGEPPVLGLLELPFLQRFEVAVHLHSLRLEATHDLSPPVVVGRLPARHGFRDPAGEAVTPRVEVR